uniref:Cytochrome c biogenesis protein CcsA n=1 Tax=Parietochloris pseudoalveolaris TaxID=3102 RepID=A0A097KLR1_9CHLO|nr:heme attachment to plastid cytochrome c [Parietochloris pseudoalveolaris]AIT94126.1 heme attachment to plastid cytochrome c [Parietochloris pseudoalveolaris]
MTSLSIELFLAKFSFIILFFSMLFYWVQPSLSFNPLFFSVNSSSNNQNKFVNTQHQNEGFNNWFQSISNFTINNSSENLEKQSNLKNIGIFITSLANFSIMLLLIIRWVTYSHFPLSNLYESLIFLSWSFTLIHIILEQNNTTISIGAIISPITLFTNAFATFSLPQSMQKATALVPALQSNWLMMHVTVMLLSYAALFIGCLLSIAFLILTSKTLITNKFLSIIENKYFFNSKKINTLLYSIDDTLNQTQLDFNSVENCETENETLNFRNLAAKTLDNLSYRVLGLGFPLLTIGILSGAIWANEAWGSYWSWDPKETWALITWLVFAIYLHMRITKGWNGKKPAIIATGGFFVVWICYLGVNLLGKGLHSYGWLS